MRARSHSRGRHAAGKNHIYNVILPREAAKRAAAAAAAGGSAAVLKRS